MICFFSGCCFAVAISYYTLIVGAIQPEGWGGRRLLTLKMGVQLFIVEQAGIACSMTGGLIGIVGCGLDVEYG